jgi:tetratricopeptide (TPR) repeat protein
MMPHAKRRQNIERMLEKTPNDPFLLYARAMTFVSEGREEEGISHLTALLESHPDYHAAHLQIGQLLAARGDIDEAKDWFSKGTAIASRLGDMKAAGEMERFRDSL